MGLVEPPLRTDILVWNGKHQSIARFKRGRFIAQADGVEMCGPHEEPWRIHGVSHWAALPETPK